MDWRALLGCTPTSSKLLEYIATLDFLTDDPTTAPVPEVKAYADAVYFNYHALGLSLLFSPQNGYKPKTGQLIREKDLALDGVDIYNIPPIDPTRTGPGKSKRVAELAFSTHPLSPISLAINGTGRDGKQRADAIELSRETCGKDLVESFGEPDRKGGGAGPSAGSIGIWCEWSKDGVMIEFGGDEARGPQAWERGKDAVWRIASIFPPKMESID